MAIITLALNAAVGLFLAGGTPNPAEVERQAASASWQQCLQVQAVKLDDAHSPIISIGHSVADACKAQFDHMQAVWGTPPGMDDRYWAIFALTSADAAVMNNRRRNQSTTPKP